MTASSKVPSAKVIAPNESAPENQMSQVNPVAGQIDELVANGNKALEQFLTMTQDQVDIIVKAMSEAGLDAHLKLARAAVDETGRGVFEDKVTKIIFAVEYIYHNMKSSKTVGVIEQNVTVKNKNPGIKIPGFSLGCRTGIRTPTNCSRGSRATVTQFGNSHAVRVLWTQTEA